jgi:hypothetical protein
MPRGPALGTLVTHKEGQDNSSPHEFTIPLCDLLLDLVESDIDGPDALFFTQIAHSFAHDILHVSTLAGALLWYEGVTSDLSRSTDLVSVVVNVEASLALLRSACDIMAPIFARFAVAREKGAVSGRAKESFNGLLNWVGLGDPPPKDQTPKQKQKADAEAKAHYDLVSSPFHFLEQHSKWFLDLKHLRDKLTHQGYSLVSYTGRVFLEGFLMPPGVAELQLLHGGYKQGDYDQNAPPRFKRYRLLETIKGFTTNILRFANDLSAAVAEQLGTSPSGTHFISGIHVPALYELLSYQTPTVPPGVRGFEYSKLRSKAWYLLRAGDYWMAHQEGYQDHFWWRFKTRLTEICGRPPVRVSQGQMSESASRWYLFCSEGKHYGVVTCEQLSSEDKVIKDAEAELEVFKSRQYLDGIILLVRSWRDEGPSGDSNNVVKSDLIIAEPDPIEAAEKVFAHLTKHAAIPDNSKWDDDPHAKAH